MDRVLDCRFARRFGVEIELNTTSGVVRKLNEEKGEIPEGADRVACIINRSLRQPVELHGWHATHNNEFWVVKPDSSCGIEVCSPVLKGWKGLRQVLNVVEALSLDDRVCADRRCSLHVHVNISDLNKQQLASVMAYYIKCEPVLFDSLPWHRKNNRYCQFLGMNEKFTDSFSMDPDEIINSVSAAKYNSMNAYHFVKGGGFSLRNTRRETMEFRTAENRACLDPFYVKNWVRLLLHFVEVTHGLGVPPPARPGDPRTGLLWLDPHDVFKVLQFDKPMSEGLKQVRNWLFQRIKNNSMGKDRKFPVVWTESARAAAREEFMSCLQEPELLLEFLSLEPDRLYGKKYVC